MGRLDELHAILEGQAPKPKETGSVTMPSRIDGFQDNKPAKEGEVSAQNQEAKVSAHRDFGTKKDPTKLRKQVGYAKLDANPLDEIMK